MSNLKKIRKKKGKKSRTTLSREKEEIFLLSEAQQHTAAGRLHQARDTYQTVLDRNPNNHKAWYLLAILYEKSSQYQITEKYLLNAIRLKPDCIRYQLALAYVYCKLHQWEKAVEINRKVLQLENNNFEALYLQGQALKGKGEVEESINFFERVLVQKPNFVDAYVSLCSVFHRLGMTGNLLQLLSKMEHLLPSLSRFEKNIILFALGRYYDLLDKFDLAWSNIRKANELKLAGVKYDPNMDISFIKEISKKITALYDDDNEKYGNRDSSPIFIIGMPRSGTSLIEQILSCHPDVNAGGEMQYFYQWALNFNYSSAQDACTQLARNYLQITTSVKKDSKYFTDKLPSNFLFAGLIHLCFPKAKIIHCVRSPIDTCFSLYKQNFTDSHYYCYDLQSLGLYYKGYTKLMSHWHKIMSNIILDVKYESVVNNLETEVRRILDYCNLTWNEKCLEFYNSSRVTDTSSQDQVTRPIYSSSVGRWKHYESNLQPLLTILNDS